MSSPLLTFRVCGSARLSESSRTYSSNSSAYVTWFHKHNPKFNAKKKLSLEMRHNLITALISYNKTYQLEIDLLDAVPKERDAEVEDLRLKLQICKTTDHTNPKKKSEQEQ
jgi:hypothetical protein